MSAAFATFCDHRSCAALLNQLCNAHRSHHWDDFDPGFQPCGHIFAGVPCARGEDRYLFLYHNACNLFDKGTHQHHVDAKGLVCHLTALADLRAELFAVGIHPGDNPQAACVRNRRGEGRIRNPGHAALEDRIFNAKQLANRCLYHKNCSFPDIHSIFIRSKPVYKRPSSGPRQRWKSQAHRPDGTLPRGASHPSELQHPQKRYFHSG